MSSPLAMLVAFVFVWSLAHPALAARKACDEFSELHLTLERNATDGDTEVVFFAKGQDDGMTKLVITNPKGRRVGAFEGDRKGIGIREFVLESAEPEELDLVLGSFPAGDYTFVGRTVNHDCLRGTATLSHVLAPETTLLSPAADETVNVDEVVLRWAAVAEATQYVVELNNEDTGAENTFQVFPPQTSFEVPAAILELGSEYQFVVGVRTADGNLTFVEHAFFTAEE